MKYPKYPKYKPSGADWFGEIPETWKFLPFKLIAHFVEGPGIMAVDFCDEGVPLLRISSVQQKFATLNGCNFLDSGLVRSRWNHFRVRCGDLLISGSASTGLCAEVDEATEGSIPYTGLIIIRPRVSTSKRFLRWFFLSDGFNVQIDLSKTGSTIQHFGPTHLSQMSAVLPSIGEQTDIADFLDRKTSKLDTLILKQRELIERLTEKRRALVSRCVTRGLPPKAAKAAGLDPHPKLKPSGIEWIGDVPEGWEVKKLSWLFLYKKGKNAATLTQEYIASNAGEFPVYSGQTANEGLMGFVDSYEFDLSSDAILVTTVGARAMTTRLIEGKFSLSQNCALIAPFADVDSRYYEGVLEPLFSYERGSISLIMQPSLRFEDLDRFYVPVPSKEEQIAIANFLVAQRKKLDALILKVEEAIDRLQEYRTALITAAVTGKIDVRGVTA